MEKKDKKEEELVLGEDGKPLSKKALQKRKKEEEKAQKKAENEQKLQQQKNEQLQNDISKGQYGDTPLVQSQTFESFPFTDQNKAPNDLHWVEIHQITNDMLGKYVRIRARVNTVRVPGKIGFLILRQHCDTLQCIMERNESTENGKPLVSALMGKYIAGIPLESVVDVIGYVQAAADEIKSSTCKLELQLQKVFVVSRAQSILPFQLADAARKITRHEAEADIDEDEGAQQAQPQAQAQEEHKQGQENQFIVVSQKTRLDNRVLDLRTPAKHAIFRLASYICQFFREFLYQQNFIEIHTPKMIGGSSEGGANVFKLNYFGKEACLAQSPQLYKQMCVMADFDKVFEIGPVFRAEQARTHRHLSEFTGLDMEMKIQSHYFEAMDFLAEMFFFMFEQMEKRCQNELKAIDEQFSFEPFKVKKPVLKFTFVEACVMLKEELNIFQDPMVDFSTEVERRFGEIVKKKFDSDFYFVHRYPTNARAFYSMPCSDDPRYCNAYDFFMRGQEITSGAQRIHDAKLLTKRAQESGIDVKTIKDYINAFEIGAFPHAGCGIGLERVVMLYCDLGNVRNCSLFPRDTKRITP